MSFGGMILKEGKTWISRQKREGKGWKMVVKIDWVWHLWQQKIKNPVVRCVCVHAREEFFDVAWRSVGHKRENFGGWGKDRAIWKGKDFWEKGGIARERIARLALLSQYFARSSYQKTKHREEKVHFLDDFSLFGAKSTHICIGSNRKVRGANEMVFWIAREVFRRKRTCISAFFRIFACLIPMGKKDQHIND